MTIGPIAFLAPWLLAALVVLPVLWWLLRAVPPSPARLAFPGRAAAARPGRSRAHSRPHAVVAAVAADAGARRGDPRLLRPGAESARQRLGRAAAGAARRRLGRRAGLDRAGDAGSARRWTRRGATAGRSRSCRWRRRRPRSAALPLRAAPDWSGRLAGLAPRAWAPDRARWAAWIAGLDGGFETLWLSDGIGHGGEAELAAALLARGPVTLVEPPREAVALTPPRLQDGALVVTALRPATPAPRAVSVTRDRPRPERRRAGAGGRGRRVRRG